MTRTVKLGDSYEQGEDVELEQVEPAPEPPVERQGHDHEIELDDADLAHPHSQAREEP